MTSISFSLPKPLRLKVFYRFVAKFHKFPPNCWSICLPSSQANTRSLKFPGPHRAYFCIVFFYNSLHVSQKNAFQYKSTYCVVQASYVKRDAMFNTRIKSSFQPNMYRIPNKAVIYNPEIEFSRGHKSSCAPKTKIKLTKF